MPENVSLENVRALAEELRTARTAARKEWPRWIEQQIERPKLQLELAVMNALNRGEKISDIARAFSDREESPNRRAIYEIRAKYTEAAADLIPESEYPFYYQARQTERGRTVHDIYASTLNFGPEQITGDYGWTTTGGEITPIIDPEGQPWPYHPWYRAVLERWVATHPVPTE